jgi:bisphosphoglycerate-dependent phosphoglycerate mutase
MKKNGQKIHKNVIYAEYKHDDRLKVDREVNPPPASLYIGLGFDKKEDEEYQRHYRRYYPDELEHVKEVMPKLPFYEEKIMRGQSRGLKPGMFSFFSKAKTDDSG